MALAGLVTLAGQDIQVVVRSALHGCFPGTLVEGIVVVPCSHIPY